MILNLGVLPQTSVLKKGTTVESKNLTKYPQQLRKSAR